MGSRASVRGVGGATERGIGGAKTRWLRRGALTLRAARNATGTGLRRVLDGVAWPIVAARATMHGLRDGAQHVLEQPPARCLALAALTTLGRRDVGVAGGGGGAAALEEGVAARR